MGKAERTKVMTASRATLVVLIQHYLNGLLDPFVSLIEVHNLMYFMQEAGQPLKLQYIQAQRGPYAENLRHVFGKIEGHLVSGYADGGDDPDKQLQLVPGAVSDAKAFLLKDQEVRDRFDRVADLVDGFETPFGLELLATVHWVATRHHIGSATEIVAETYAWNDRKRQFSPSQIKLALDVMVEKNWIAPLAT